MSDSQIPAHALWVELSTRITTQRLHHRSGAEETAVESVVSLFKKTRELLTLHPGATEFQRLAEALLNHTLRPATARWHGWMTAAEKAERTGEGKPALRFKDEWVRRQFRRELRALQPRLLGFQKAFAALKDSNVPEPWWTAPNDAQLGRLRGECVGLAEPSLGQALAAGIGDQVRFAEMPEPARKELCERIDAAEHAEIRRRRGLGERAEIKNAAALAFSGGGIRSATFCLGITQVLARRGLLKNFDYLSTVSGGGYFGAFLSAFLGSDDSERKAAAAAGGKEPVAAPKSAPAPDLESRAAAERIDTTFLPAENRREPRPLRHLRNRSRYLADNRFQDKVIGIGMVLVGVAFNLLLLLPVPLTAVLVTMLFHRQFHWFGDLGWVDQKAGWVPVWNAPVSLTFGSALGLTALLALAYPWIKARADRSLSPQVPPRVLRCWRNIFWGSLVASALLLSSWLVPFGFRLYLDLRNAGFLDRFALWGAKLEQLSGLAGLSATALLGVLATRQKFGGKVGWVLEKVVIFAGPLLYLYVFYAVGYLLLFAPASAQWRWEYVLGAVVSMVLWGWWLVDINTYSPHSYYRDRLAECYLIRPKKPAGAAAVEVVSADRLKLSDLGANTAAPYHLLNTTVNLPSSDLREMRGRKGDFFVFSKHFCGSPMCGYHATKELEAADPHLNLGTAMAISGAAASSNMGRYATDSFRLVMTLANVRLGYWLRNPRLGVKTTRGMKGPGPSYLFREMFASGMNERGDYLNLSDGGHIENLAAYELLRRRCKFIVCVDGGAEPGMECEDLMRLERFAAIDLGIKMHYDISDLRLQANGYSRAYGVLVKIDYNPPQDETARGARKPEAAEWGWMLYVKLAMVGYGPGYVMDYKRQHPDFPHQSTAEQIYDEGRFEAYRALGEAAAESFFTEELVAGGTPENVAAWFTSLVSALLPDNDEVFGKA